MRVGLGHDIHRLAPQRRLVLGGVTIEHDSGLVGHSDADALLHAITDALLGAAGLGDIGTLFPDTDPQWKDADSADLLAKALEAVQQKRWNVENLDCTIFAEKPKLASYKPQIEQRLAQLLQTTVDAVNVKAKTGETVGPVGRQEAIAADAIVLLVRQKDEG